jgi:ABC-type Fe3+/spermidine/putrescine transport system ATPase subunit
MIKIENVSKSYGSIQAVDNVTMTLAPDEVVVILGPSGCGKTSLLRLIAGFEYPDSGWIKMDDQMLSSKHQKLAPSRRHLNMVFQDLGLWPHMTVFNNIAFGLKRSGITRQQIVARTKEILQQVSLQPHQQRFPSQLSGGEKQRLAIGRAIATTPDYLLLDEPFNNLDVILKQEMIDLLLALKKKMGMGILYVTHHLDEVLSLADRVIAMQHGQLRQIIENTQSFNEQELLTWYTENIQPS